MTPPHAVRFGKARVAPGHCLLVSGGRCSSLVSPYTKASSTLDLPTRAVAEALAFPRSPGTQGISPQGSSPSPGSLWTVSP